MTNVSKLRWTKPELVFLADNYAISTGDFLQRSLPNRNWNSIKLKARQMGLWKERRDTVSGDVSNLLAKTSVASYWRGFFLADGCIHYESMRLIFHLANKDSAQVERFAKFINCTTVQHLPSGCRVAVQDKYWVPRFAKSMDLRPVKTYNPPQRFDWLEDEFFEALLIGFIDGDGNIRHQTGRSDSMIRLKLHSSWRTVLQVFSEKLARATETPVKSITFDKLGYAELVWSRQSVVEYLKRQTEILQLPVLERKWRIIDLERGRV